MARKKTDPKLLAPFRHQSHRRPVTRREFLAQGFLTGSAYVAMPAILSLLTQPKTALAQMSCALGGGTGNIPFLCFDLAGGANIAGSNALVGLQGQMDELSLDGYRMLGLPESMTPQVLGPAVFNEEFGLKFHSDSALLRGMLARTSPTTRDNVNGVVIAARSANDTGNNPHNPVYGINRAGASGGLLELVGTEATDSGGNSAVSMDSFDPSKRPTKIDRPSDARGLVDTGEMVNMLGTTGAGDVMQAVEDISKDKIVQMAEAQGVSDTVTCAYEQSRQLIVDFGDPNALDPLLDPDIAAGDPLDPTVIPIFAGQAEVDSDSHYRKTASVMKLVVEGKAGAGTIEFGGYDYHNSTRATGEIRDELAGESIGAALEFAARRNQDLMIYVFSDGSVFSNGQIDNSGAGRGKGVWTGDNSSTAASLILVYGKDGRPPLRNTEHQIGLYRSGGSVETSATAGPTAQISNSPEQLAEAIVLNYLALHGREGEYAAIMNNAPKLSGTAAELDQLIGFTNIRAPGV
jgi:hypothetical protein